MTAGELAEGMAKVGVGLIALAIGVGTLSNTIRRVVDTWRAGPPRPVVHATCGVIDPLSTRPCVLALGHHEHEHAGVWEDDEDDDRREARHRWDANGIEGRTERRWKPPYLPKFTPSGERP